MSDELDPEVLADLQLQASSIHDRTRSRPSEAAVGTWTPTSKIVAQWTCRAPRCSNLVEVPPEAVEQLATFNGYLRARNEREIPTDAVMVCDSCRQVLAWHVTESALKRNVRLKDDVKRLKASKNHREEHDVIRQLAADRHPDIAGLLELLDRQAAANKGRKKGDL